MIQNATKWEEFLSLGTGGGGDGVKPKFGQSVSVFIVNVVDLSEYFAFSFRVHETSSSLLSFFLQIIMRKCLSVQIIII